MRHLRVCLSVLGVALILGACGASATAVTSQVQEPVVAEVELAETEPVGGSLSDFLSAEPALPTDAAPAEEVATPPAATAVEAAASSDNDPPDSAPLEGASQADADEPQDVLVESSEAITIEPSTVPTAGDHTLEVAGNGFTPGVGVLVVSCVLPGEPLLRNASLEVVADRLELLDVEQDCAFDNGVETSADDQGEFVAQLSVPVETNSMLLAADLVAELGAYVLVPIAN